LRPLCTRFAAEIWRTADRTSVSSF
jgi:hypothetical protein